MGAPRPGADLELYFAHSFKGRCALLSRGQLSKMKSNLRSTLRMLSDCEETKVTPLGFMNSSDEVCPYQHSSSTILCPQQVVQVDAEKEPRVALDSHVMEKL